MSKDVKQDIGQRVWNYCEDCGKLGWAYHRREWGKIIPEIRCLVCWEKK